MMTRNTGDEKLISINNLTEHWFNNHHEREREREREREIIHINNHAG
jgi:hypothetical protein